MPEKTDLVKQGPQALEKAPDYLSKSKRGFEDTVQSDVMIPRLALAQNGSPQATDGDPRRIEGCVPGSLFNSVTGQIYGGKDQPVYVQLLRKMPLRAMEFRSIDDGGGVIDPNVPLDDERLKWGNSGDKKADRPQATLFRDFLAVILPQRELIALSFKSSGIKAAKELWGLAMGRNKDVFAGRYAITSGTKLDPKPHQIYKVANAGWVSEEDARLGEGMYEAVQSIKADRIDADGGPDPDDFDPAAYEASHGKADPGM